MIIDATNLVLGRMATKAAKEALKGEEVVIVNCEKAVITGNRKQILANYNQKIARGQVNQGPYFPKRPDMLVRRTIRGMLPRKKPSGRAAFGKVKCHVGVPSDVKADTAKSLPEASIERIKKTSHFTVNDLCKQIGYKQY
jgi:large subunit ribosomal protein L13